LVLVLVLVLVVSVLEDNNQSSEGDDDGDDDDTSCDCDDDVFSVFDEDDVEGAVKAVEIACAAVAVEYTSIGVSGWIGDLAVAATAEATGRSKECVIGPDGSAPPQATTAVVGSTNLLLIVFVLADETRAPKPSLLRGFGLPSITSRTFREKDDLSRRSPHLFLPIVKLKSRCPRRKSSC
jgi:hypothetical protein